MINVYHKRYVDSTTRKVYNWLGRWGLEYNVIDDTTLTEDIIKNILKVSDLGFDEILVNKNKVSGLNREIYSKYKLDSLSTKQLIQLILTYPTLLKTPIIYDEKKLFTGFDNYELRKFLPRVRERQNT